MIDVWLVVDCDGDIELQQQCLHETGDEEKSDKFKCNIYGKDFSKSKIK